MESQIYHRANHHPLFPVLTHGYTARTFVIIMETHVDNILLWGNCIIIMIDWLCNGYITENVENKWCEYTIGEEYWM